MHKSAIGHKDINTQIGVCYYRISIHGGEAQPAFNLPFKGRLKAKLNDHTWVCEGQLDPRHPDYYQISDEEKEEIRNERKALEDYHIVTDLPFYENGVGYTDGMINAVYLFDTESLKAQLISPAELSVYNALALDGKVYFAADPAESLRMDTAELYLYDPSKNALRKLTDTPGFSIQSFCTLGHNLVLIMEKYTKYHICEESKLYLYNIENESVSLFLDNYDSLFNSTGSDCRYGSTRLLLAANQAIYLVKTMRNDACLYKITSDGKIETVLEKTGSVDDFAVSEDGKVLIVGNYDGRLHEVYAVEEMKVMQLSSFNTEILKDKYISKYHKMTIQSQGLDIDGWVLYPKGFDPASNPEQENEFAKYPAILDIHGGPRTVFGEIFYHEMQAWANMGYFVFFCNPIGGSGRGFEFADITDAYGSTDFENIMNFTDAVLKKYPQIDPARVGCTGGSYGGL